MRKYVKCSIALLAIALGLSGALFKGRPLHLTACAETNNTEQSVDGMLLPAPGKSVALELSAGEAHSYRVSLDAGQYLHVIIEPQGVDAGVRLYDPAGGEFVRLACRRYGPTPVSLFAEAAGIYRLEVRSLESEAAAGRYQLTVEALRPATARDKFRVVAEKTFAEGEELLREWKAESNRRAIAKFTDSLPSWRAAADGRGEALALKRIGDVYRPLGQYENALSYYRQALALSEKIRDRRGAGETLNDLCYVYVILGDNPKAVQLCARALKLSRATGSRRGEAQALNNFGEIYYGLGQRQQSLEFYRQALSIWREVNDREGQALALLNFGYTYSDLGETQAALDSYNHALALWRVAGDQQGQAVTLTAIGRLYSRLGENQDALNFFNQATQFIGPIGDPIEEARIFTGMAAIYDDLGEKQRALEYYDRALPLFRSVNYRNGEANVLYDSGKVYYSLGNNERALGNYQLAYSLSEADGDHRLQFFVAREIGRVYDLWGDKGKALKYYLRTLPFWQSEKDLRAEADTLNLIGHAYEEQGRKQRALDCYETALPLSQKAEYRGGEAATLYNIARLERDRARLTEARARIEAALEVIESLRTKVASQDLRASYFATVRQQYEFYIDLLMRLHRQRPAEGFDRAAFEASERARARSLLETLADARVGVLRQADPALLEREHSLRAELSEKAEQRIRLEGGGGSEAEAVALAKQIDELAYRLGEVEAQIRASSMEYTASLQTRPLSLRAIQEQVVDDDTILLEYSLGDERSYLWAVSKTSIQSYELSSRAEIEGAANRVKDLLIAPQPVPGETLAERQERVKRSGVQYWHEASVLATMLIEPAAARIATKRLLIVPDGALQYIPFSALPQPAAGDAGPVPLVVEHEITVQPSASTLAALRSETAGRAPAPKTVAVFADPVFEKDDSRIKAEGGELVVAAQAQARDAEVYQALRDVGVTSSGRGIPRLPATRAEAEAIMAVTPVGDALKAIGFEANKAAATSAELGRYRIIHFATHGVLDSERPELSGLVFSLFDSQGRPQNGFLQLNDIYNLDLSAELVVLSACNTGLGKDVKGEGLISLVRGFMHAGAPRVLATLWKVDDEATAELMSYFYRQMLGEGKTPAAALREAQIATWRQRRWQVPYFWAGFVLQGEYKGKIEPGASTRSITAQRVGAAASLVLLFGLYLLRRRILRRNHVC